MSNNANVTKIVDFLTKNSFGSFPAREIQRITGLSEVDFKAAWKVLRAAKVVSTIPSDKKFWTLTSRLPAKG